MFKILVVLLVGAFIASHATPYDRTAREKAQLKREVEKNVKCANKDGRDCSLEETEVDGDTPSIKKLDTEIEPEADAVKEEESKPDGDTNNNKEKTDPDGHDLKEEASKDGDTPEKNQNPVADAVKEAEESNVDGDSNNNKDKTDPDGHDLKEEASKDGDTPAKNKKPVADAVKEDEESKVDGDSNEISEKTGPDGHDLKQKLSKDGDTPARNEKKKEPIADAVKEEGTKIDGDSTDTKEKTNPDGHDLNKEAIKDGDIPISSNKKTEPVADAVKEGGNAPPEEDKAVKCTNKESKDCSLEQSEVDGDTPSRQKLEKKAEPVADAVKMADSNVDGDPKDIKKKTTPDGHDLKQEGSKDGDTQSSNNKETEPNADAVKEEEEVKENKDVKCANKESKDCSLEKIEELVKENKLPKKILEIHKFIRKQELAADAVKEDNSKVDGHSKDIKQKTAPDGHDVEEEASEDGDTPESNNKKAEPKADAVKEEEPKDDVDSKDINEKAYPDGHDVEEEASKDGDTPTTNNRKTKPVADAVMEEEETEANKDVDAPGSNEEAFVKEAAAEMDGHDLDGHDFDGHDFDGHDDRRRRDTAHVESKEKLEKDNDQAKVNAKDGHPSEQHLDSTSREVSVEDPSADAVKDQSVDEKSQDFSFPLDGDSKANSLEVEKAPEFEAVQQAQEPVAAPNLAVQSEPANLASVPPPTPAVVAPGGAVENSNAEANVQAEKANEAIDKTQQELDTKVNAIEGELDKAIDDQNKEAVAGQSAPIV